jgi:xanthine permease XanP
LGLQQVSVVSVSLFIPVLVAKAAGMSGDSISAVLSFSMITIGIASLLQAFSFGPVGSGYLIPGFCSANYLSASVTAAHVGGLPLVYGMNLIAGVFEVTLSRFMGRLRPYFAAEISGLAVTIIGLELGMVGAERMFGIEKQSANEGTIIVTALLTFFLSVLLSVYGKGTVRLFCVFVGVAAGYATASVLGLVTDENWRLVAREPLLAIPTLTHLS